MMIIIRIRTCVRVGVGIEMRKVLLVNDDLVFRAILEQVLIDEGYDVICVEDGIAALSILENQSLDLILLDIMIPKLDGFQLLAALQRGAERVRAERICPIEVTKDNIEFDDLQYCVSIASERVLLTQTEYKLLKYLFERKGEVITKQELQRSILQKDLGRFDRNLDMHVSNTRRKLANIKLPKTLINTVRGQGYSFAT